jgi:hypothetical protein
MLVVVFIQVLEHSYKQGTHLNALDHCKLLQVVLDMEAWRGLKKWTEVKKQLKTSQSAQTLRSTFGNIVQNYKRKTLKMLRA